MECSPTCVPTRIQNIDREVAEYKKRPDRSPSPPPYYDGAGRQLNDTRARLKDKFQQEKRALLQKMMTLNPTGRPQATRDRVRALHYCCVCYRCPPHDDAVLHSVAS